MRKEKKWKVTAVGLVMSLGLLAGNTGATTTEYLKETFEDSAVLNPLVAEGRPNTWRETQINIGAVPVEMGTTEIEGKGYIKRITEPDGNRMMELKSQVSGHTLVTSDVDLKNALISQGAIFSCKVKASENCGRAVLTLEQLGADKRHYAIQFLPGNRLGFIEATNKVGSDIGTYKPNIWYDITLKYDTSGTMSLYMVGEDGSLPLHDGQTTTQSNLESLNTMHFKAFVNNMGSTNLTGSILQLDNITVYKAEPSLSVTANEASQLNCLPVTFNNPIDFSTVDVENFVLLDGAQNQIPIGDIRFTDNKTVCLLPVQPLQFGGNYSITVQNTDTKTITDIVGNTLSASQTLTCRVRNNLSFTPYYFKGQTRLTKLESGEVTVVPVSVDPLEEQAGFVAASYTNNNKTLLMAKARNAKSNLIKTFSENFESGLSNWSAIDLPNFDTSTPAVTTDLGHKSNSSYGFITGKKGIVHTMGQPMNGLVEIWMYDDAGDMDVRNVCHVGPDGSDGNYVWMGVHTVKSAGYYVYRIGNASAPIIITNIPRTTGWHKLTFDYTSLEDVKLFIDDQFAGISTGAKNFSEIRLMDLWGEDEKYASRNCYDDIAVYAGVEPIKVLMPASEVNNGSIGCLYWSNETDMSPLSAMRRFTKIGALQ